MAGWYITPPVTVDVCPTLRPRQRVGHMRRARRSGASFGSDHITMPPIFFVVYPVGHQRHVLASDVAAALRPLLRERDAVATPRLEVARAWSA